MARPPDPATDTRRSADPAGEAYLRRVGERVRLARARRGMSRKILSQASGVSERYLADLESGTGNASLLVLRQIATAMGIEVADLVTEAAERPVDFDRAVHLLQRLSSDQLADARALLSGRFDQARRARAGRIALIGLRGAGKTTIGLLASERLGVPFIELDREIEQASGMELSEIFASAGQSTFRRLERDCLQSVIARHERVVIATGGSLVASPAAYDMLLAGAFVVWLRAAPEAHMARVTAQGDLRPMAGNPGAMDDLRAILDSRQSLYARADAEIDTTTTEPAAATESLLALAAASGAG